MHRWQRFTDGARDVILLAREEACALKHDDIGVEHLLLGLVRQDGGDAARVLESLDVSADRLRERARARVAVGGGMGRDELSFTQDANDVMFHRALVAALPRGGHIKTEHLLLGVVYDDDAAGAGILREIGCDPGRVRAGALDVIGPLPARRAPATRSRAGIDPSLLSRFSNAARRVVAVAGEEARDAERAEVCTEHLLLAMLRAGEGDAARVLEACGITLADYRQQLQSDHGVRPASPGADCDGELPMSELAMRALRRAAVKRRPGEQIGTEHILLGMIGVRDNFGPSVLVRLGVTLEGLADVVEQTMNAGHPPPNAEQLARTQPGLALQDRVTLGYGQAIAEAQHTARMRGREYADLDDLVTGTLLVFEGWPSGEEVRDKLLEGAWPLLGSLVREIGEQLDRELDAGDLLVLLASVPGGIAATALASVGADPDALADAVKQARDREARSALLWPAGLGSEIREEVAAREHKSQLELLTARVDARNERVDQSDLRTERGRDELLELLRRRLGLR